MGVAKKPHEVHMRLQLHYSTVNDVLSFTFYLSVNTAKAFLPVFPDFPAERSFEANDDFLERERSPQAPKRAEKPTSL
jgi:hypothetical protein